MLQAEEIDEQVVKDTIEGMGAEEKVESYCKIIRQFEADSEAYKTEKQRFADKQSQAEKNIKRLKNNLLMFLIPVLRVMTQYAMKNFALNADKH